MYFTNNKQLVKELSILLSNTLVYLLVTLIDLFKDVVKYLYRFSLNIISNNISFCNNLVIFQSYKRNVSKNKFIILFPFLIIYVK